MTIMLLVIVRMSRTRQKHVYFLNFENILFSTVSYL